MKKKMLIILSLILLISLFSLTSFMIYKSKKEKKEQQRYSEIKESVMKAVQWNIKAQYPGCTISKEFKKNNSGGHYNSKFLIQNGYIKKQELLDVDEKSYCDVYVDINRYFENSQDQQQNCEIYYKIYLKCKDYEDKGYINWG